MQVNAMYFNGLLFFFLFFLSGCGVLSDYDESEVSYNEAKLMPGFGYVVFDFREAKALQTDSKTHYTIHYVNDDYGHSFILSVVDVDFKSKVYDAYIPFYKNYTIRGVYSEGFMLPCNGCHWKEVKYYVEIYSLSDVGGSACKETVYKNHQTFDYTEGCKDDWREKGQVNGGSVFVTPHLHSGAASDGFTSRPKGRP